MVLKAENKNAPSMSGWMIALVMGIVAAAVAIMIGEFRYVIGAFFGVVVFLAAGLVMGMPWGAAKAASPVRTAAMPTAATPSAPVPVTPVATAAPVIAAVAAPVVAATPSAPAAPVMAMSTSGPEQLTAARGGKADDLKEIEGIGPALEKLCNELGFYHFDQIASWSDSDVDWVDRNMKNFKGRIARDKWVAQSKLIVAEGLEAFRIRAKTNDY